MIRIASNGLSEYKDFKRFKDADNPEVDFIAQLIRNWTRARNTRLYTITYAELNTNLSKFNVYLDDPSGNMIGVFKKVEKKTNVNRDTILEMAEKLSNGNMKDEGTIRDVIGSLSKITGKNVSKEKEDKIVKTILNDNVPDGVDKMF